MNEEDQGPLAPEPTQLTRLGEDDAAALPERIGNYRILQQLGQGGMGVVYAAEQERPVRRKVALKVIKLGMDTEQVVVRFESERQALALMNHPCIARVYDAGATAEGRPYFAMEYVQGVPITDYCQRRRLGTRQRLELFIRVCEAVQHAHQKGIIHRDIKPSNVLVRDEDGQPIPKIIDFGIAKATAQRLTEKTLFTEMGQLIGTPEYMSPEQAEMSGIDIDTRTDVYQLGVLLYELLTGELPFGAGVLRRVGFNEFRRQVLEEEPPRPSTRVTGLAVPAAGTPAPESKALARALKGDLDWITMRALEKDRTRRYPSASELAAEVGRYLRNEPVLAGPPGNLYRLRKFVRRHKAGVAFAAVLLVLLSGFAATMTVQLKQISQARDLATEARDLANQERDTAEEVSEFLAGLFKASEPGLARGREISAREILDRGAKSIREEMRDSPKLQARLMSIMGDVYISHGLRNEARDLLEYALQIQIEEEGDTLEAALTMQRLGAVLASLGDTDRARRQYERSLEIREAKLPPDHALVAKSLNNLANVVRVAGDYETALQLYERAFEIWEKAHGPDDPQLATMLNNQAALLKKAGDFEAARPLLERVLAIRRGAFGHDHPDVAWSLTALGKLLEAGGDYAGAETRYREALAIREKLYKQPHPEVAGSLLRLGVISLRLNRPDQAASFERRAREIYELTQSFDSQFVLYDLAGFAALAGRREQALQLLRRAVLGQHPFSAADDLRREPNLAPLQGDAEFESIVAAVRSRERDRSR